jgi:hypothetical protein
MAIGRFVNSFLKFIKKKFFHRKQILHLRNQTEYDIVPKDNHSVEGEI